MRSVLVASLFIISVQTAWAGFFIEPYLAHNTEIIKFTDLVNSKSEVNTMGPLLGLKLGYRSLTGIDLNLATEISSGSANITGLTEKPKFQKSMSSFQLGVNTLGMVKMFLGSSLSNELKLEDIIGFQGYKLSGPSYHAGLQFRLASYLNLGLQYNLHQYNTIEGSTYGSGNKIETYYNKVDTQDYCIYLSSIF